MTPRIRVWSGRRWRRKCPDKDFEFVALDSELEFDDSEKDFYADGWLSSWQKSRVTRNMFMSACAYRTFVGTCVVLNILEIFGGTDLLVGKVLLRNSREGKSLGRAGSHESFELSHKSWEN